MPTMQISSYMTQNTQNNKKCNIINSPQKQDS